MHRFLVRVDKCGVDRALRWDDPPTDEWSDKSGKVKAWVWDGRFHRESGQLSLRSSITHDIALDDIDGPHVDVRIDANGVGTIEPDSLGLHPLYCASWRGAAFASSCLHLVSEALAKYGASPSKSLSMSTLLTACERPIGLETGFEHIRCTPFGAAIVIHPNHSISCSSSRQLPWARCNESLRGDEVGAAIDDCADEMIMRLGRWVLQAPDKPTLLLTGGLDSRLILALAIEAGCLDDVDIVTYGDAKNPDVVVAAELARRLGVRHTVRPPRERAKVREHVNRTAGMLSCRMSSEPEEVDSIILHGLMGETLRSNVRTRTPLRTRAQVIAAWIQPHARAGMLRHGAHISALTRGLEALVRPLDAGLDPEAGLDVFYVQHLVRRWISARPGFFANKVFPLYSPRTVALALKLGWKERRDAVIHEKVIARVGGPLLDVPYAPRPRHRPVPRLSALGIDESRLSPADIAASAVQRVPVGGKQRGLSDGDARVVARYRAFVTEARNSAIWDVLDREKLRASLDSFPMLDARSRLELHSAMSGVLWHS